MCGMVSLSLSQQHDGLIDPSLCISPIYMLGYWAPRLCSVESRHPSKPPLASPFILYILSVHDDEAERAPQYMLGPSVALEAGCSKSHEPGPGIKISLSLALSTVWNVIIQKLSFFLFPVFFLSVCRLLLSFSYDTLYPTGLLHPYSFFLFTGYTYGVCIYYRSPCLYSLLECCIYLLCNV